MRFHRDMFNAPARSKANTTDRRNALASLENMETEIAARSLEP
jgi:hypothetical protein